MVSTDQCVMNYPQWADEVDFLSNDHYFHEGESHLDELVCSDALMDSMSLGKPWYVMEHSTSAVQWKPLNARKRNGELLRDSLAHVAMGADAICFSSGGSPHRVRRRSTPRWCRMPARTRSCSVRCVIWEPHCKRFRTLACRAVSCSAAKWRTRCSATVF